jgi:SAM-dependent methyltransferase
MSARQKANAEQIKNINFIIGDAFDYPLKERCYDLVLCQSFLHHCRDLRGLLEKLRISLKPDGLLVLNDYVGPKRFQWRKNQLMLVNRILNQIPFSYKIRTHSNTIKSKVYSPGILRMLLSDPSEAIESHKIITAIREYFRVIEEKRIGGNILHLLFKDIAHNFLGQDEKTRTLIQRIFELEDDFLRSGNESDFIFGVYKPRS